MCVYYTILLSLYNLPLLVLYFNIFSDFIQIWHGMALCSRLKFKYMFLLLLLFFKVHSYSYTSHVRAASSSRTRWLRRKRERERRVDILIYYNLYLYIYIYLYRITHAHIYTYIHIRSTLNHSNAPSMWIASFFTHVIFSRKVKPDSFISDYTCLTLRMNRFPFWADGRDAAGHA